MRKGILVLLVVLLLLALTMQVALANPDPPHAPSTGGSCHMLASWWDPNEGDTGPGNAFGVEPGDRGMYRVHMNEDHPQYYTQGAANMDAIGTAHGCG